MYHVRTYKGGAASYDPRQITWAVFQCDACGKKEEVNITGREHTFQFHVPRRCPHCKSFGKDDRIISVRKEIENLTATRNNIDVTIEKLTAELESLQEK